MPPTCRSPGEHPPAPPTFVAPCASLLLTLVLLGCPGGSDKADDTASRDTAADDTAPDTADDTADDTAPGEDTAPPVEHLGAHVWTGAFRDAPDLRITACGTTYDGPFALASGADLDGDGLHELAVGVPTEDGVSRDEGAVYFYRGDYLADAPSLGMGDAWSRVVSRAPERGAALGERVQWVGDRDGDGVEDLLVWQAAYGGHAAVVSGADLLDGGEVEPNSFFDGTGHAFARWEDLDGDGRADWLVSFDGDFGGGASGVGLATLGDPDFDGRALGPFGTALLGLGGLVVVLDEDRDGDGRREIVTQDGRDLVVVSSAAFLAGAPADEAVLDRLDAGFLDGPEDVLDLGDVDGGGANELLLLGDDRVCVTRGEDADPAGAPLACVLSTDAEPPTAVALGADLDGDGVREVWAQLSEALVAWDGASLLDGVRLERARIAHAGSSVADTLSTDEAGALWTASADDGTAPGGLWRFAATDGLDDADARPSIVAVPTGRDPGLAVWSDLTGDGSEELVFFGEILSVFDGTRFSYGGEFTVCDADAEIDLGLQEPLLVEDVDGDGIDDLVGWTPGDTFAYELRSGSSLDITTRPPIRTWSMDRRLEALGCDLDADGRDDFYNDEHDVTWLVSGALVTTGDPEAALLGVLDGESLPRCIPDAEGDGRPEVAVLFDDAFVVFLSSQLDPTRSLTAAEAHATFVDEGDPAWAESIAPGDLDGDGVTELLVFQASRSADTTRPVRALCAVDPALVATGGELAATAGTCGAPWHAFGSTFAVAHAVGDDRADLVAYYENTDGEAVFGAIEDDGLGTPLEIALVPEGTHRAGGFGPDVLGTGAPALWATTSRGDDRPVFEMLFARLPGEE